MPEQVMVSVFTWEGVAPGAKHWHVDVRSSDKKYYEICDTIEEAREFVGMTLAKHFGTYCVTFDVAEEFIYG